jgi:predicted RND superfamily exporter protein
MTTGPDRPARFVQWVLRNRVLVLTIAAVLGLAGLVRTAITYANLRSDLEELLPESAPSVRALEVARARLPGLRHLGVVVETGGPANVAAATRFVDDLARRIRGYGPEVVSDVRMGVAAERHFAETYALQLMEPADVAELRRAAEARRDWEVTRASGMDILDDEEEAPELPLEELRKKYEARYGASPRSFPGDRFVSDDGQVVVMVVRASAHGTGYGADADLIRRVRHDAADLGFPGAYARGMRMGFAGDVPTRVEEMEGLIADLSLSGLAVLALVVLSIVGFFRSFWALPILGVPLLLGSVCAFGAVALPPLSIRHLNSNTAFLGSIVVGNGINTGIILLARFGEERDRGAEIAQQIVVAVRDTWRPTLAAAAAASAAYGSLVITDFRGFNQFGWIGGIGMMACWAATMVVAPPLIERWGAAVKRSDAPGRSFPLAGLGSRIPRLTLLLALGLTVASVAGVLGRNDDWLETDFSKLRRRDSWVDGERYFGRLMDRTLGRYLTPTVLMAHDAEDAQRIATRVREVAARGGAGDLISAVREPSDLIPSDRSESITEAKNLRDVLTPRLKSRMSEQDRRRVERALSDEALVPVEPKDVPSVFAAGLREKDGRMDRNVLVFPRLTTGTWDATRMAAFTADLRAASSVDGHEVPIAGSLLLSSDIVTAMKQDGPRATALALAIVLTIAVLAFRSATLSMAAVLSLLAGVAMMLGGLAWTGQRFNFSNFVALPITFGIAADYSINVLKRFQTERAARARDPLR